MVRTAKKEEKANTPDRPASKPRRRRAVRAALRETIGRHLRKLLAPLTKRMIRHQVKLRRFGGVGALLLGAALIPGALGPIGLTLILLGMVVLLIELERMQGGSSDRRRK